MNNKLSQNYRKRVGSFISKMIFDSKEEQINEYTRNSGSIHQQSQ